MNLSIIGIKMLVYVKTGNDGVVYKVRSVLVPAQNHVEIHNYESVNLSDNVFIFYGLVPILQIRRKSNLSLPRYFITI